MRYHLLMSDMAQKRDIGDPRTVRDFAKAVKTRKRLDLLTVLTVCDIRGVGPGTWNNWKAMLLRQLYSRPPTRWKAGLKPLNRENREDDAKRRAARPAGRLGRRRRWTMKPTRHYAPYWQGLSTDTHAVFARLLQGLGDDEIRIDLHPDPDRDATRACFALADHPGIFSRLAGALALVGANVVDARTYTSKDGYATAVFWVQDIDGKPYEIARLPRLRGMIDKTLKGEVVAREALKDRDKIKKREREFRFPTHITFDNEGSDIYTIIEVDTRDRPGLLYDLTRTLAANNIYIASRRHRDLWRAGGGHLLRQGHVRPEAAPEAPARGAGEEAATGDRRGRRKGAAHEQLARHDPQHPRRSAAGRWCQRGAGLGARPDDGGLPRRGPGGGGVPVALSPAQHVPPLLRRRRVQPWPSCRCSPRSWRPARMREAFARDAFSGLTAFLDRLHADRHAGHAAAGLGDGLRASPATGALTWPSTSAGSPSPTSSSSRSPRFCPAS